MYLYEIILKDGVYPDSGFLRDLLLRVHVRVPHVVHTRQTLYFSFIVMVTLNFWAQFFRYQVPGNIFRIILDTPHTGHRAHPGTLLFHH